ncbi:hypothetical protein Y032_0275g1048 [Ancylostoma ceylanicum]|uniref:Uncharacterized protein n=1 Tax=Ancylostoma ceylanicum TaxID=53326 RepID=A0A016S7R0_9BILA|nr:hypothetical protein Y032_0275g1048 [Ancylostoma ceylanicum]
MDHDHCVELQVAGRGLSVRFSPTESCRPFGRIVLGGAAARPALRRTLCCTALNESLRHCMTFFRSSEPGCTTEIIQGKRIDPCGKDE